MPSKTKKIARDIRLHVYNRPTNVRNASGAFVSSVQVVEGPGKPKTKKPAKKKAASKSD